MPLLLLFSLLTAQARQPRELFQFQSSECNSAPPLLEASIENQVLDRDTVSLGTWRLPYHPERPSELSDATLELLATRLKLQGTLWGLIARIHFKSKEPYGLPFSFERLGIHLTGDRHKTGFTWDWTLDCTEPGYSLFPGQTFEQESQHFYLEAKDLIFPVKIYLWGVRN